MSFFGEFSFGLFSSDVHFSGIFLVFFLLFFFFFSLYFPLPVEFRFSTTARLLLRRALAKYATFSQTSPDERISSTAVQQLRPTENRTNRREQNRIEEKGRGKKEEEECEKRF